MKVIFFLLVLLGCGSGKTEYVQSPGSGQRPGGGTGGDPTTGKASFAEAQQIMNQYCLACHANAPWLSSERGLRQSSVRTRTANRNMPPLNAPQQMPEDARARLLSFF